MRAANRFALFLIPLQGASAVVGAPEARWRITVSFSIALIPAKAGIQAAGRITMWDVPPRYSAEPLTERH
jgi:disulfide bond formation protein DsbB